MENVAQEKLMNNHLLNISCDDFKMFIALMYEWSESRWSKSGHIIDDYDDYSFSEYVYECLNLDLKIPKDLYIHYKLLGHEVCYEHLYQYFRELFKDATLDEVLDAAEHIWQHWGLFQV